MEIDYYECVSLAQQGDHDKLVEVLTSFTPVIRLAYLNAEKCND